MIAKRIILKKVLPALMTSHIMSFACITGLASGYIKKDFDPGDDLTQLIPFMALGWFFLLAVPSGILQDKYGKRKMLLAMIFMGTGNTIGQVSAIPLLYKKLPEVKYMICA